MSGQNFSQSTSGIQAQAPAPNPTNNNGMFFSSAAALLRALFAMQNFQQELQKDYAALEKETAQAYAGIGPNGEVDPTSGIAAIIQTADIAIGDQQASGLSSQKWGSIMSAGFAGGCLTGMGIAGIWAIRKSSGVNAQVADAEQFKNALNEPANNPQIEMRENADNQNNPINRRIQEYEQNLNLDNFQGKKADGTIDTKQAGINKQAVEQISAKPEVQRTVLSNVQKRIDSLNGDLAKIDNAKQYAGQVLQLVNSGGGSGGQAYGSGGQATAAKGQAQAQAQADLEKQVQPQLTDLINQSMQQSTTWGKNAQDTAGAIYQTLSAMTHV